MMCVKRVKKELLSAPVSDHRDSELSCNVFVCNVLFFLKNIFMNILLDDFFLLNSVSLK